MNILSNKRRVNFHTFSDDEEYRFKLPKRFKNKSFLRHTILNRNIEYHCNKFSRITPYAFQISHHLEESSSSSCRVYGRLLNRILRSLPKINGGSVMHLTRINIFPQGEFTYDFSNTLTKDERRLLDTGRFKKFRRERSFFDLVFLGTGHNGTVLKAIDIGKLMRLIEEMRASHKNIEYVTIKKLKKELKSAMRNSIVAEKRTVKRKFFYHNNFDDRSSVSNLSRDVHLALENSDYVIIPFARNEYGVEILELALTDVWHIFLNPSFKPNQEMSKILPKGRLEAAKKVIHFAAKGLEDIHKRGVIHHDIKPQNMVLTRDGVKYIDFEFSNTTSYLEGKRLSGAFVKADICKGTPSFLAPEVFDAKRDLAKKESLSYLDRDWFEKVDLYAFGISCCTIVLGDYIELKSRNLRARYCADVPSFQEKIKDTALSDRQKRILCSLIAEMPSLRPSIKDVLSAFPLVE